MITACTRSRAPILPQHPAGVRLDGGYGVRGARRISLFVSPDAISSRTLWVPKTYLTWADALQDTVGPVTRRDAWRAVWFGLVCDDLRLVGLKLIFLIVTRAVSVLGRSRREAWSKDAGILMLRHHLAVALRERPRAHSRLTWPDRARLALLAGTLPAGRWPGRGGS
jgi:hypothetical protein